MEYNNRTKWEIGDTINGFDYLGNENFYIDPQKDTIIKANFKCPHCGNTFIARVTSIETNSIKSCGCLRIAGAALRFTKHGLSQTPEYTTWASMKSRCYYTKGASYTDYGGRGITVCDRWLDKEQGFLNFLEDMGSRPKGDYSLDRINNEGNYNPENCRWTNRDTQNTNNRATVNIEYNGKIQCLSYWAAELGLPYYVLRNRIQELHWNITRAFETPFKKHIKSGEYTKSKNILQCQL